MPIEHHKGGGTTLTGKSIEYFAMVQALSGLKLEMKGIRIARGVSCYALIKKRYGLKGSREKVLTQFQAMVDGRQANQKHIDHDGSESGGEE